MEMDVRPGIDRWLAGYAAHRLELTLHCRGLSVDGVEHVGQHQEQCHQQPHPARDNRGRDQEAHPGDLIFDIFSLSNSQASVPLTITNSPEGK